MAKFRKKPVVIDAWRYVPTGDGAGKFFAEMPDWLEAAYDNDIISNVGTNAADTVAKIKTLEGVMTADRGDWIIRGVKGEIYPCKPDIFEATYEPA